MNTDIFFITRSEIKKVLSSNINKYSKAKILASVNRLNTLAMIKNAGSGHMGTSLSAMDIFIWLKFFELQTLKKHLKKNNRNIFFFVKGS